MNWKQYIVSYDTETPAGDLCWSSGTKETSLSTSLCPLQRKWTQELWGVSLQSFWWTLWSEEKPHSFIIINCYHCLAWRMTFTSEWAGYVEDNEAEYTFRFNRGAQRSGVCILANVESLSVDVTLNNALQLSGLISCWYACWILYAQRSTISFQYGEFICTNTAVRILKRVCLGCSVSEGKLKIKCYHRTWYFSQRSGSLPKKKSSVGFYGLWLVHHDPIHSDVLWKGSQRPTKARTLRWCGTLWANWHKVHHKWHISQKNWRFLQ